MLDKGAEPPDDFMPDEPTLATCEPLMYAAATASANASAAGGAERARLRRLYAPDLLDEAGCGSCTLC